MSILNRLAHMQGRRDEEPNKNLAQQLVAIKDVEGIREVAANLQHADRKVQSDCVSVLEQVGRLAPQLSAPHCSDFLEALDSKNNRLVWGAMINLALIADEQPQMIFEHFDDVTAAIRGGSVITRDNGVKTLAIVAAADPAYSAAIFPFLLTHLQTCRSKSVPQHAESMLIGVTAANQEQFVAVLNERFKELSPGQQKRVKRLLKRLGQNAIVQGDESK